MLMVMQPQQPGGPPAPNYDFIFNPPPQKRGPRLGLGGGNSVIMRVGMLLGGLLVLLIIISVIKSAFSGNKSSVASLNQVLQSQQELIHLTSQNNSAALQTLSQADQNFAVTTQMSVVSEQSQL